MYLCCTVIFTLFALDFEGFMTQVKENHQGLAAAYQAKKAAQEKAFEAQMVFQPIIAGNVHYMDDRKRQAVPAFMGTQTKVKGFEASLLQKTSFGTQGRLFYNFDTINIVGTNPGLLQYPKFSQGIFSLEITHPLWRNAFGTETRAQIQLAEKQVTLAQKKEMIGQKVILLTARGAFLRLWLSQEVLRIQKAALERAKKLKIWAQSRIDKQLADQGDLLSAQANLKAKEMDVELAIQEEKMGMRALNVMRNQQNNTDNDSMPFKIEKLTPLKELEAKKLFQKVPSEVQRLELELLEAQVNTMELQQTVNSHKYKPQLDLFAQESFNSRESASSQAFKYTVVPHYPTTSIGIKLTMPIGGDALKKYNAGLQTDIQQVKTQLSQKTFDLTQEKKELTQRFHEIEELLVMIADLKQSLFAKLQHERNRLEVGRSTTFQVLSYEGEYSMAELNYIKYLGELFKIAFQLQLFVEEDL